MRIEHYLNMRNINTNYYYQCVYYYFLKGYVTMRNMLMHKKVVRCFTLSSIDYYENALQY